MADIIIDSSGLAGTVIGEGESRAAAVVKEDGNYMLTIEKIEFAPSSNFAETKNVVAKAVLRIQDEDEKGGLLYWNETVTGEYMRGETKVNRLQETVGKLLLSVGRPESFLAELVKAGKMNLTQIGEKELLGKTCYAALRTKPDNDGKMRTEASWFLHKTRYEATKKSGSNFRVSRKIRETSAKAPNGAISGSPTVTDQMADGV